MAAAFIVLDSHNRDESIDLARPKTINTFKKSRRSLLRNDQGVIPQLSERGRARLKLNKAKSREKSISKSDYIQSLRRRNSWEDDKPRRRSKSKQRMPNTIVHNKPIELNIYKPTPKHAIRIESVPEHAILIESVPEHAILIELPSDPVPEPTMLIELSDPQKILHVKQSGVPEPIKKDSLMRKLIKKFSRSKITTPSFLILDDTQ